MLFIIPMGLFILFFYVNVIMRFVFRVDVSPLKNVDASMLGDGTKANRDQIVSLVFFAVFMCIMLIASLSFFGPLQQFLAQFGMFGVVAIIVGIMMMIKREDGTPLLNFYKAAAKIGWERSFNRYYCDNDELAYSVYQAFTNDLYCCCFVICGDYH